MPTLKRKTIVTSALPYVNNVPHLGNMICIISADVYARYLRMIGRQVIAVIGTDEHGTTTQVKAMEEGLTPQQICDKYYVIQKKVYEWFNTSYDHIGRTSSPQNKAIAQDIFLKLNANGYILEKETEQYFDPEKQMFLADRFVEGTCPHCAFNDARGDQCDKCGKLLEPEQLINPRSKLSKATPILRKSKHLFIDLPKIQPMIQAYVDATKHNWSENAQQTTDAWLKEGLTPRCITRDLTWGVEIPVPGYENKKIYSWFDAPIGYIGITAEFCKDWKEWWHNPTDVELVQFMGKDNTTFHTILFPGSLLGAKDNYTTMDRISVNEYLNYADGKFSKSRGTGVFGDAAMETGIPADAYRYYLMAIRPEKEDTVFDWIDFGQKVNKELIDNYANLINRVCTFINSSCNGELPTIRNDDLDITKDIAEIKTLYEEIQLRAALKACMTLSRKLNAYFQEKQPWKTIKENPEAAKNTLAVLLNKIHDVTICLSPFVPKVAEQVFTQLNSTARTWKDIGTNPLKAGHRLGPVAPLLVKLEETQIQSLRTRFMEKSKEFALDLRVAKVLDVQDHPDAAKLYVLQLDVGDHKRQVVSGLRPYMTKEEVVGKNIVLVANLAHATIRGVKSQGMLLAGQDPKDTTKLSLLETKFSQPGEPVFVDGFTSNIKEVSIDEVKKAHLIVQDKKVLFEKRQLKTKKENVTCDLAKGDVS